MSFMKFFWLLRQQKDHGKRVSALLKEIDSAGDVENLSHEERDKLIPKVKQLKMYKIGLDSYPEEIKKAIASAPIYFLSFKYTYSMESC